MATKRIDSGRRRFLTATTSVVGGAGVVLAAVPFIESWKPSARAQQAGAPVEVDLSLIEPGQMERVQWRGQPVWIVRRTERALAALAELEGRLRDPNSAQSDQPPYARNPHRSIRPEWLVVVGLCTHLGCSPLYYPEMRPEPFDSDWKGGFFCPCHNSRFDLAGRVFQGVPAPLNLRVPPYRFLDDRRIRIGEDQESST
jgi:ubiquinol-cytochrome c reductase iron-sulfur subunit